ncbi:MULTISPECIES: hypothetical protein [unclassified Corallococcus]|uniref:hypothetical protein n=1 Tax=unclassified Corallococcus TaxID=2685029 RepID=UPI001A8C37C4|nr:hypothetical protein [Corallococcus sp. NCRR]MBN9685083.1 hypothetical protein [Corallococcus sp. NCSPR001]WAS83458.1 hypothetical protein O0N60_29600 [Corallococcus sp. NCRR]
MLLPVLTGVWLSLSGALGTELRRDGYSFRPPDTFRMARWERYTGSQVGAVSEDGMRTRALSAALADGEGPDAATFLIAVVDGGFSASPAERDSFSTAVVHHFQRELGVALTPERVDRVGGPVPRVEVLGTLREAGQVRTVLVTGLASEGRHAVVTVSAPAARWDALAPGVRASLETFRMEAPVAGVVSRRLAGALAGTLAGALLVSYAAWRRRRQGEGPATP